jgi:hypothetical protein
MRPEPDAGFFLSVLPGGGRRLAFATRGSWGPSALVVLRAMEGSLVENCSYWNAGHIHRVVGEGGLVAFLGLVQSGTEHWGVGTVDLVRLAAAGEDARVYRGPGAGEGPVVLGPGMRYFELPPRDFRGDDLARLLVVGGKVRASTGDGIHYALDPRTGEVRTGADDLYLTEYADRRREGDPETAREYVEALARRVRVYSGD